MQYRCRASIFILNLWVIHTQSQISKKACLYIATRIIFQKKEGASIYRSDLNAKSKKICIVYSLILWKRLLIVSIQCVPNNYPKHINYNWPNYLALHCNILQWSLPRHSLSHRRHKITITGKKTETPFKQFVLNQNYELKMEFCFNITFFIVFLLLQFRDDNFARAHIQ